MVPYTFQGPEYYDDSFVELFHMAHVAHVLSDFEVECLVDFFNGNWKEISRKISKSLVLIIIAGGDVGETFGWPGSKKHDTQDMPERGRPKKSANDADAALRRKLRDKIIRPIVQRLGLGHLKIRQIARLQVEFLVLIFQHKPPKPVPRGYGYGEQAIHKDHLFRRGRVT